MDNLHIHSAHTRGLAGLLVQIGKSYQVWADIWLRSGWRIQENAATGAVRVVSPRGKNLFHGSADACHDFAERLAPKAAQRHAVILLHGMGRTRRSFTKLEGRLRKTGLTVVNVGYASLSDPVETHLRRLRSIIDGLVQDGVKEISFISHSLGSLLVRQVLADTPDFIPRRVMFLGPPNQGSALALRLSKLPFYKTVFGHGGSAVFESSVKSLFIPNAQIAVIAGGNGAKGYNRFLAGDNDGLVMVSETRLDGREAFLRLPCLHGFLPTDSRVHAAIEKYLQTGRF